MLVERTGVTICDENRATPGYTLFAPLGQPHAYIIDMRGEVVHQWDLGGAPGNYAYLLPSGNLLAAVRTGSGPQGLPAKGGHLKEFDWDGNLVWEHIDDFQHHDFRQRKNGNIVYVRWELMDPADAARVKGGRAGSEHPDGIHADVFREINREGETVWQWHAADCEEFYEFPLNPLCPRAEFSHCNALFPLDNGDLLANWRFNHTMAIIDRRTGRLKWHHRDLDFGQQHHVQMLDNGNLLFFANGADVIFKGPRAGSKVVEFDPATRKIVWQFEENPPRSMFSWFIGSADRLANGNTLINEGVWGRLFEVSREGEVLWNYISPFLGREMPYQDGNCIFRAYRYSPDAPELKARLPADPW